MLEKLKKYLKPKVVETLSSGDKKLVDALLVQLDKLSRLIDIFIAKESALDKFLTNFDKSSLQELTAVMDDLKRKIVEEWGDINQFKDAISKLNESFENVDVELRAEFRSCQSAIKYLFKTYSEQLKLISKSSEFLNDKMVVAEFVNTVYEEGRHLTAIFNLETKYCADFCKVKDMEIPYFNDLFNSSPEQQQALAWFIRECINLIREKNISTVLVTEDSARILGIMLKSQLGQNKVKNVAIFGFNPRVIIYPKLDVEESDVMTAFKTQRKALTKCVINKNVLLIDEFAASGETVFKSKEFFEKFGAKKVFTAIFASGNLDIVSDIRPQQSYADWTHTSVSGREKDYVREALRTRTIVLRSKYKVMNDLYQTLVADYREFMKKIAAGKK